MKVIDNFLPDDVFANIYEVIIEQNLNWTFGNTVARSDDKREGWNYFYSHIAYEEDHPTSTLYNILLPFVEYVDNVEPLKACMRIMVNAYPHTPELKKHQKHFDFVIRRLRLRVSFYYCRFLFAIPICLLCIVNLVKLKTKKKMSASYAVIGVVVVLGAVAFGVYFVLYHKAKRDHEKKHGENSFDGQAVIIPFVGNINKVHSHAEHSMLNAVVCKWHQMQ